MCKYILSLVLLTSPLFGQHVEWASSVLDAKNIDNEYEANSFELALGPPVDFSNLNQKDEKHDLYADGYIILPNKNKKLQLDFGFKKPAIANKIYVGGVLNDGVIKKCILILKNNKTKTIYSYSKSNSSQKHFSERIIFSLETVYGVRLIIDHTKAESWNVLKGIGAYKTNGPDTLNFLPDLVPGEMENPIKEKVENGVNTKNCAEFNPKLTADGRKLFFVRECANKKMQEQIWVSEGAGDKWNAPVELSKPLNNSGHNYVVSTALDTKVIFVGNVYNDKAEETGPGLSKSTWSDERKEWGIPEKVQLPSLMNNSEMENYYVSPDQQAIIVAMERADGIGKMDLYVSLYNKYKKEWEEPINLGSEINTEFTEDFPYLSFDDQTLFFSSTGRIGYGSYDVYMTKRLDNTWQKWSKPQNLGLNINSKTDDFGFTISSTGETAYFSTVSIEGDLHNVDIFKLKLPKILQQPALTAFEGKITNEKSGLPVSATIKVKNLSKKVTNQPVLTTNSEGKFTEILTHGEDYEIEIEAPRFFKIIDKISLKDDTQKGNLLKTYRMQPFLDSGQVAVLKNIQFKYSSTDFTPESAPSLDELVKILAEQKKMIVEIGGHSDDKGSDTFNLKLSRWRAAAVVDFLINKGIRPWRLKSVGYGETAPIASNDTDDGRALNRRVEMLILEDDFSKKYAKKKKEKSKGKRSVATIKTNVDQY